MRKNQANTFTVMIAKMEPMTDIKYLEPGCDKCGASAKFLSKEDLHTWNGRSLCSACLGGIDEEVVNVFGTWFAPDVSVVIP